MALTQHTLGAAAVIVVVLRVGETGRLILGGLWKENTVWLLTLDGPGLSGIMLLTAYFGLHHRVSFVIALLCTGPFLVFWRTRKHFERRLVTRLDEARRAGKPPKPLLSGIEVACPSKDDPSLVMSFKVPPALAKALRRAHRVTSDGPRALALALVICVLAVSGTMLAAQAAAYVVELLGGSSSPVPPTKSVGTTSTSTTPTYTKPTTQEPGASGSASLDPSPNSSSHTGDGSSGAWHGECKSPPSNSTLLQYEVEIEELYVGNELSREGRHPRFTVPSSTGAPPGREEAGCTEEYHNDEASGFVWAWGEVPGSHRHLSITVDSAAGPALFLEPAAREVHKLIAAHKEVSGIRRFNAGWGDLYPVSVPGEGTYILIRREKGTEETAGAYEVMPPSISEIWVTTVNRTRKFYWPRLTREEGRVVYDFDTNTPATAVAYTVPYEAFQEGEPPISEDELERATRYAG